MTQVKKVKNTANIEQTYKKKKLGIYIVYENRQISMTNLPYHDHLIMFRYAAQKDRK